MNKTNLLRRIIQTTSIASVLTIGITAVSLPAKAFTLWLKGYEGTDITDNTTPYPYHDGNWDYTVTLLGGPPPNKIKLTVTGTPSPGQPGHDNGDAQYLGEMYTFPITNITGDTYSFSGPSEEYSSMSITGTYDGTGLILTSIVSGDTHYVATEQCPEPSQIIGLLGLGIIGTASTLKRKKKELDKVS